jgi:hypothetical protein
MILFFRSILLLYAIVDNVVLATNFVCQHMVVFGDSFTDRGTQADEINSHGFYRYSNGPVWSEYVQKAFKCDKFDSYAYSGAKSGIDNYYFNGWSGVQWQVNEFVDKYPTIPSGKKLCHFF